MMFVSAFYVHISSVYVMWLVCACSFLKSSYISLLVSNKTNHTKIYGKSFHFENEMEENENKMCVCSPLNSACGGFMFDVCACVCGNNCNK